ncbi:thioesterase II family protein [Allorhodopirellula solitaria]|uniref:Linear gramicidin dehydrogenase LgrE n=1 Tax=Allorhodopirellula solitaria TaxID=2527987 RepID=A0A5C5XRS5_9BACT|nr:alpha/beta fold hydrolase [Allorhodopirellula solitaria]TWT65368.1 Linear gramicidin dehydrogenase LgrE [Allorhodopirellula solitaria]
MVDAMKPPGKASPWFTQLTESGQQHVVICLPYAGMGSAVFGGWSALHFDAADLFAAQLPGRDGRLKEAPIDNIEELVDQLADAVIEGPFADRPLTLLGCSFGGLIAFELARRLRAQGRDIEQLIVAACRPPNALGVTEPVASLPDEEMVNKLRYWYGAIPKEIAENPAMLELVLPAIRADMRVYETHVYREEQPLQCPITAIGGADDRIVKLNELNGWRKETTGKFTCRQFAGDHFFMKSHPAPVLRLMQQRLRSH